MGLLSAITATGALIFLPFLACLVLVPIVALVLPEHPADIGIARFGELPGAATSGPLKHSSTAGLAITGLLSLMGLFDLFGTTASGWLTDRHDPRKLLVFYYGLRGLSLFALPFLSFNATSLTIFAVFYGLDWIATVPPTVKLANMAFGEQDAPIVFGWIRTGHQLGAATAAFGAGVIRQATGSYLPAFTAAGVTGVLAVAAVLAWLSAPRSTTLCEAMEF